MRSISRNTAKLFLVFFAVNGHAVDLILCCRRMTWINLSSSPFFFFWGGLLIASEPFNHERAHSCFTFCICLSDVCPKIFDGFMNSLSWGESGFKAQKYTLVLTFCTLTATFLSYVSTCECEVCSNPRYEIHEDLKCDLESETGQPFFFFALFHLSFGLLLRNRNSHPIRAAAFQSGWLKMFNWG